MASNVPPPPTFAEVIIKGPNGEPEFNPIWLQWFLLIAAFVSASGGGGGGAANHNSLAGLQGGTTNEYYHFTNAEHTALEAWLANQALGTVLSGPVSGGAAAPTFKALNVNVYKPTDQSVTSNITPVNDSALSFAIGANETWMFRFHIHFGAAINTTGIKVNISAPTGATGSLDLDLSTDATSGNENYLVDGSVGTAVDIATTDIGGGAANGHLLVHGFVANGATAGTVQLQWAQSSSSATALTAFAGSQLTAARTA